MTPGTLIQLAILMTFVVPGIVYQAVRARLAGEAPQNRDITNTTRMQARGIKPKRNLMKLLDGRSW